MYDENFEIIESDGLVLTEMTEGAARSIASWTYGGEYAMYDFDGSREELEDVMNGLHFPLYAAEGFDRNVRSIITDPVGFVAIGPAAQIRSKASETLYAKSAATDIAVGLRPDLCGKGEGLGLRLTGIAVNFVMQEFPDDGVRLSVAENNKRAIKVYEKAGFKKTGAFSAKMILASGKTKTVRFMLMELQ